jgi:hypothetical protein
MVNYLLEKERERTKKNALRGLIEIKMFTVVVVRTVRASSRFVLLRQPAVHI